MSLDQAVALLQQYGYFVLFPLAIIEGPIVTIIGGLFVATGIFNPFIVYAIAVAGDIVGDSFWYAIGRYGGGPITRFIERVFGIQQATIQKAKERMERHRFKTTMLFKFSQGIGFAGFIAAGIVRVSYPLFVLACLIVTLVQAAVFLYIGIAFGSAYHQIGQYFDYVAEGVIAIAVVGLLVWYLRYRAKR
jgi:membrane protein DedA with SNARE-associated domain